MCVCVYVSYKNKLPLQPYRLKNPKSSIWRSNNTMKIKQTTEPQEITHKNKISTFFNLATSNITPKLIIYFSSKSIT